MRRLVVSRTTCAPGQVGAATTQCVLAVLAELPTGWKPPVWGLFPVDIDSARIDVAAGVETAAEGSDVRILPGGLAAVATHVGPYEDLALAYQGLFAWIYERGHRPSGPVREGYLADPSTSEPAQLVTRLVVPLEDSL
jgi:effector-binding domain-containing protein